MGSTFRNIKTIAGKELRGYFASPVAWVMMGLFAFIFGRFFDESRHPKQVLFFQGIDAAAAGKHADARDVATCRKVKVCPTRDAFPHGQHSALILDPGPRGVGIQMKPCMIEQHLRIGIARDEMLGHVGEVKGGAFLARDGGQVVALRDHERIVFIAGCQSPGLAQFRSDVQA